MKDKAREVVLCRSFRRRDLIIVGSWSGIPEIPRVINDGETDDRARLFSAIADFELEMPASQ